MNSFTTITDDKGEQVRVHYGWRNNEKVRDIGRYRHLLLDVGVTKDEALVTYAVAMELIGERSYVCDFRIESGSAPGVVGSHMQVIAEGVAVNIGCEHCDPCARN